MTALTSSAREEKFDSPGSIHKTRCWTVAVAAGANLNSRATVSATPQHFAQETSLNFQVISRYIIEIGGIICVL